MSLEKIFSFLLSLDEATSTMITIVSVVSGIIAIVGQIWTRSQQKNGSWVWGCIIVISMLVIVGTITRKNLAEIPDVVNYTYEDAQGVLSSNGFKYNLEVDKGLYVVAQKPVAGIVAPKGTKVELVTASIGSNPILVDGYTNGLKVGNIEITYKQMEVFLEKGIKYWNGMESR